MPCITILYFTPAAVVLYAMSYVLRGLRAVVLCDNRYRRRFIKYFSRGRISAFMTTQFIAVLGVCAVIQQVFPQKYG